MKKEFAILAGIIVLAIIAFVVGSNYYKSTLQTERKTTNSGPTRVATGQLVRSDSPTQGPANAKVTLVEFYDPECEACAAYSTIVKGILKESEGRIRLVLRYMPLHPNSVSAAAFTEAAGEQGKYWQAQELLFQKQSEWGEKHGGSTEKATPINVLFEGYAKQLGMDADKIKAAVESRRFEAKIERDKTEGQGLGVRQTPTFFVNGRQLMVFGEAELKALIAEEMAK